jgi:hypothetical protein
LPAERQLNLATNEAEHLLGCELPSASCDAHEKQVRECRGSKERERHAQ